LFGELGCAASRSASEAPKKQPPARAVSDSHAETGGNGIVTGGVLSRHSNTDLELLFRLCWL
jgi:hypothetical protein